MEALDQSRREAVRGRGRAECSYGRARGWDRLHVCSMFLFFLLLLLVPPAPLRAPPRRVRACGSALSARLCHLRCAASAVWPGYAWAVRGALRPRLRRAGFARSSYSVHIAWPSISVCQILGVLGLRAAVGFVRATSHMLSCRFITSRTPAAAA